MAKIEHLYLYKNTSKNAKYTHNWPPVSGPIGGTDSPAGAMLVSSKPLLNSDLAAREDEAARWIPTSSDIWCVDATCH